MTEDPSPAKPPSEPGATTTAPAKLRAEHVWVSTTYFGEGYPYAIVNNIADILFKELGASLQVVGLTSLFHLPWNLKFLWGPFVDEYETKRRWLLAIEALLIAAIVLVGLLVTLHEVSLVPLAIGFLILAVLSATHDIAIDGFYLEALDERDQSAFVGYRAAAYKIAVVVVSSGLIWICARFGWSVGLFAAALVMAALLVVHAWLLPKVERSKQAWTSLAQLAGHRTLPLLGVAAGLWALEHFWAVGTQLQFAWRELEKAAPWLGSIGVGGWIGLGLLAGLLVLLAMLPRLRRNMAKARGGEGSSYAASFVSFLDQPKVGLILAFVLLFRTGESFLLKMRWPFFDDAVGLSLEFYAETNGLYGVIASFGAAILGGRLIARDGLRKWIWPFVLAQNVLNLLYMGLAMAPDPQALSDLAITAVIVAEHVGSGFGTAVFMVYLMRACDPEHKAGHFAIVSALMSVSFTLAGVVSGFLAEALGFATYFGFTFLATIPSMVLIWFVPYLDGRSSGT